MNPKYLSHLIALLFYVCVKHSVAAPANPVTGGEIFKQCAACHTVGAGASHGVGPTLNHVFGRIAGMVDGYANYSSGMIAKGSDNLVWHEKTLYKFLANPGKYVPATTMAFAGLKTEQEIKDVLSYIITFSPAYTPKSRKAVPPEIAAKAAVPESKIENGEPESPDFTEAFLTSSEALDKGAELWVKQCRHCHGNAAYPGKAPKLTPDRYTADFAFDRLTNGFRKMPAWKSVFTLEERKSIVAYVLSREFSP